MNYFLVNEKLEQMRAMLEGQPSPTDLVDKPDYSSEEWGLGPRGDRKVVTDLNMALYRALMVTSSKAWRFLNTHILRASQFESLMKLVIYKANEAHVMPLVKKYGAAADFGMAKLVDHIRQMSGAPNLKLTF